MRAPVRDAGRGNRLDRPHRLHVHSDQCSTSRRIPSRSRSGRSRSTGTGSATRSGSWPYRVARPEARRRGRDANVDNGIVIVASLRSSAGACTTSSTSGSSTRTTPSRRSCPSPASRRLVPVRGHHGPRRVRRDHHRGDRGVVLYTRWKLPFWRWADIVAPGLFVMQAVGRWGNFFNQELYGPPTNLPWGIAIDCDHRVARATRARHTRSRRPTSSRCSSTSRCPACSALLVAALARARRGTGCVPATCSLIFFIWYGGDPVRARVPPERQLDVLRHPDGPDRDARRSSSSGSRSSGTATGPGRRRAQSRLRRGAERRDDVHGRGLRRGSTTTPTSSTIRDERARRRTGADAPPA